MHDSELIRRHTLDRAGFMFVTDLIKDMLTSPTLRWNAIVSEMDVISTLTLATGKNATMQQWWFGSVTTLYKQSDHTNIYSTFWTVLCRCSFPKLKKKKSMIARWIKNKEYIYIYNVCVYVWERVR